MMPHLKVFGLIAACAILLGVGAVGADDDALEGRHLRVTGAGQIRVSPDIAVIQLAVEDRAALVSEAMTSSNQAVARLLQALADAEVAEEDVLTTEFSVRRVVERQPRLQATNQPPLETEVYVVRNRVQVTIHDLSRVGRIIDVAMIAGANEMRGLRFALADDRQARDQARALAVDDARHRAEQLARLHGVQLGRVLRISEQRAGGARPEAMMLRAADSGGGAPISAGDLSFGAGIEVIYELQD